MAEMTGHPTLQWLAQLITEVLPRRRSRLCDPVLTARQYSAIGVEISSIDKSILAWHRSCEASRRLEGIPGIGPIVATALVAEVGDWQEFRSGRSLAAEQPTLSGPGAMLV